MLAASPQGLSELGLQETSDVMEWVCWDTASCSPQAYSGTPENPKHRETGIDSPKRLRTRTAQGKIGLQFAKFEPGLPY